MRLDEFKHQPQAAPPAVRPDMLPPPPPPPQEDDGAFVRRVRLVYLDRVTREHQRLDLIESPQLEWLIVNLCLS